MPETPARESRGLVAIGTLHSFWMSTKWAIQSDAAEHLYVAVDGEANKRVPGVREEAVELGPVLVGRAQLEEQHRMILADEELDQGWFLILANVVGVLHINSDDLVAHEFEVSLVLLDGGRRLV